MLFNPAKKMNFMPSFPVDGKEINLVEKTTLLGLVIRSDLSWSSNTEYVVGRCNSKLWILRRLKKMGATQVDLLDVYVKQVRSILEYAVPVWHSSITGEQRLDLERIQKSGFHIILGELYVSYSTALKLLSMETLNTRRTKLCKKFVRKSVKNDKFSKWFKINNKFTFTRQKQSKYCEVFSRTVLSAT